MTDDQQIEQLLHEFESSKGFGTLEGGESAICASLRREERLQYSFVVGYQALVFVLALATLGLLLVAAWSASQGEAIAGLLEAAGAIASGVAATFLLEQRADARKALKAARRGLVKHHC